MIVTDVVPTMDVSGSVAEIVAVPGRTLRTSPPSVTVATSRSEDVHDTRSVMSRAAPSVNVPVAASCRSTPGGID